RRTLFCSQLVLQSYRQAGVPITDADPRLISPADILHMRDGDVSSVRVNRPLRFVGHLKYQEVAAAPLQH
ncbi:MAG: distant relative of cell wall-associated hydrolase, partial [Betaproteobacteria bacterium]|nr:distant relative of cell wall-associated hydrolase [Betaproteobacteria bacterium]